jgi:hypothetical protein
VWFLSEAWAPGTLTNSDTNRLFRPQHQPSRQLLGSKGLRIGNVHCEENAHTMPLLPWKDKWAMYGRRRWRPNAGAAGPHGTDFLASLNAVMAAEVTVSGRRLWAAGRGAACVTAHPLGPAARAAPPSGRAELWSSCRPQLLGVPCLRAKAGPGCAAVLPITCFSSPTATATRTHVRNVTEKYTGAAAPPLARCPPPLPQAIDRFQDPRQLQGEARLVRMLLVLDSSVNRTALLEAQQTNVGGGRRLGPPLAGMGLLCALAAAGRGRWGPRACAACVIGGGTAASNALLCQKQGSRRGGTAICCVLGVGSRDDAVAQVERSSDWELARSCGQHPRSMRIHLS